MPSKLTVRLWLALIMLLPATTMLAQQRVITGKVTDQNNQAVAGATITVKGTTLATQTNASGTFFINVFGANTVLVFSSVVL